MGDKTRIEWCDATWNPVTGCSPISAGCANCYAERQINSGRTPAVHQAADFREIKFHPHRLEVPFRWKRPRRIFVCSMGDLFHEDVDTRWIQDVFCRMFDASQHTFMVLTKRPERMKRVVEMMADNDFLGRVLPNLWLGVTAENQEMADLRIPVLLQTPAAKRFVSVEPMLGPVDLSRLTHIPCPHKGRWCSLCDIGIGHLAIGWIICGGESGPGARPMHPDWARSLRDQCQAAGVPFFFKQWGEWGDVVNMRRDVAFRPIGPKEPHRFHMWPDRELSLRVGKLSSGSSLDGKAWKEFPA